MHIDQHFKRALHSFQTGSVDEAQRHLRAILDADPRHFESLQLMGQVCAAAGQFESAQTWLTLAQELCPDSSDAHSQLGVAFIKARLVSKASAEFQRAIELQPHSPAAWHNLANAQFDLGLFRDAEHSYREAMRLNPALEQSRANLQLLHRTEAEVKCLAESILSARTRPNRPQLSFQVVLSNRQLLPHLLNRLGLTGTAVEIGVAGGVYSDSILRIWQGERLYSIDPWREFSEEAYVDVANDKQAVQDQRYMGTIRRLLEYGGRSVIWRLEGCQALDLIPDASLDFCYIDANHAYEAVREDLAAWFPKMKPGAIFAGHDYIPDGDYPYGRFGVQSAVNEFVVTKNLPLFLTNDSPPSWFVVTTP